jgi:hypothetical protein
MQRHPPRSALTVDSRLDGIYVKDILTAAKYILRLCRMLRIPKDGQPYAIPSTFGPFPHLNVGLYDSAYIPPDIKRKGGLVIPILQYEAMALRFGEPDKRTKPFSWQSSNYQFIYVLRYYTDPCHQNYVNDLITLFIRTSSSRLPLAGRLPDRSRLSNELFENVSDAQTNHVQCLCDSSQEVLQGVASDAAFRVLRRRRVQNLDTHYKSRRLLRSGSAFHDTSECCLCVFNR